MVTQVQIVEPDDYRGCLVLLESFGIAGFSGYALWQDIHPVAGIVGGIAALILILWLFTFRVIGLFFGVIFSIAWAALAWRFTDEKSSGDLVWILFVTSLVFLLSVVWHYAGVVWSRERFGKEL
ncbi:MAG: hypothetical protein ACT4QA_16580 [Panacagrimonas sp.]